MKNKKAYQHGKRQPLWLMGLLLIVCSLSVSPARAQIGTWRNHLAYYDVQQIQAAGNYLFVMASNGVYQYNKTDQSITTYDKVNGLSDVTVTNIKWCQQASRLVIVYDNSNIDLMDVNGNVTNISDIYSRAVIGGKRIYCITVNGQYAYLGCDFGVVKLDVRNAVISETYMLGYAVNAIAFDANSIYINTATEGVRCALLSSNMIDPTSWTPTDADSAPSFDTGTTDYNENIELVRTLKPGGPKTNYCGFTKYINGRLYTCNGNYQDHPASIQYLENDNWTAFQDEGIAGTAGTNRYEDIFCIDTDPNDPEHVFAGGKSGLYEFQNGRFVTLYNSTNSPIEAYNGKSMNTQLVTGVKFENNGTLWILNSSAPTTSLIKYANGTFTKHNHDELMKLNYGEFTNHSLGNMVGMMTDANGILWFVNNNGIFPGLYRYNTATDELKAFTNTINQDETMVTIAGDGGARCAAQDLEGNMWLGTSAGLLMLEKSQMDNSNYHFTQVKIPRNDGTNYADYLLAGIDIASIAVDGAGRKWIGTNNQGVYLISADNMTQIQHFTTSNSFLLSDAVKSISINPTTGEVFFGTEKGLCSYVSDATSPQPEMSKDAVWAYPNPVDPDYTGLITVTGLALNADVKIVAANGALVAEGQSNGGTFTWDGYDKKGRRVASGIYMVVAATSTGEKGTVCKIAIVR